MTFVIPGTLIPPAGQSFHLSCETSQHLRDESGFLREVSQQLMDGFP